MSLPIIRAELSGSRNISAGGINVTAEAPIIGLCIRLLEAGYDPRCPMEVYRGDEIAVRVNSIGQAAQLRVTNRRDGRPIFAAQSDAAGPYNDFNSTGMSDETYSI